jgi:hypothetical protein
MRSEKFQTGSKDSSSATAALIETIAMRFICLPNVRSQQCRATGVNFENTAFAASAGLTC